MKLGNGVMKSYSLQWCNDGKEMYRTLDARAEVVVLLILLLFAALVTAAIVAASAP